MYFYFISGSKIMLVTGGVADRTDDDVIEIIDVEDPSYSCPNSLSFNPISSFTNPFLYNGGGGMVLYGQNDIPFFCGGNGGGDRRSDCWQLLSR